MFKWTIVNVHKFVNVLKLNIFFIIIRHQTHPQLFRLKSTQQWQHQSLNIPQAIIYYNQYNKLTKKIYYTINQLNYNNINYNNNYTLLNNKKNKFNINLNRLKKIYWSSSFILYLKLLKFNFNNKISNNYNQIFQNKSWLIYNYSNLNPERKKIKFFVKEKYISKFYINIKLWRLPKKISYKLNILKNLPYYNFLYYKQPNFIYYYNFNNNLIYYYMLKWNLSNQQYKFNYLNTDYNSLYNNTNFIHKYKILMYLSKLVLLKKIKFVKQFNYNLKILKFKSKNSPKLFFLEQIKFLWRSKFTYNLFIIYNLILTTKIIKCSAIILLNYLQIQFRILFSKQEQKLLLYLILNFNKIFIQQLNINKLNYTNNLILLQLIITGRWQRKRWVTPFPKTYISSPYNYNKLSKKIKNNNYYLSYAQKSVWTRKGNIGLRLFLLYNRK